MYFLPKYESLSEVYKNKINAKSEGEEQMKSYKLVDNVDKSYFKRSSPTFTTSPAPIVRTRSPAFQFSLRNVSISAKDGK